MLRGVMLGLRDPRAHDTREDSPDDALALLGFADHLFGKVRAATRTRRRRSS